ncbi:MULTISPECIES: hypothetical protein [unclassified Bradyrhizobium]|uniref:hypothetical protein n=1 Tax=unclassified Bradyrhizobium TaxID=2631580 RepID=UPI00188CBE50|nr:MULTISPECIES: hypothetical protein [unclassified Bradyrhizobium]MDN4981784.1 hypothetical protein [Bradyrhizobium sp. WYCCWR 13022]QOZ52243.1 hypothetical protein XH90_13325 [Bradyrhizobium sp. CCBAU 53338]
MPAYLVRLIDSRQIVGFFFVDQPEQLANSVNDWTEGDRCEYVKLPAGGLMWPGSAVAVPMTPGPENDANWDIPELPFASATMSESWLNLLYGYPPTLRWTKLKPRRKTDSTSPPTPTPMGSGQVIPMRRPR